MIQIRPFKNSDLKEVLRLNRRSDSTNRSVGTWKGNNITAMLAFDGRKLIGAIPLEPRLFSFNAKEFVNILWVSGAHVDVAQRNRGIGSAMDAKIKECFFPKYKAVFVFRHDEKSAAYKWYKKIGYQELLPIISLKKQVKPVSSKAKYLVLKTQFEIQQWEKKVYDCFRQYTKGYGGFPRRYNRFWSDKLNTHYYRDFYAYSLLILLNKNRVAGYAFLGKTDIRDTIMRFDILEIALPKNLREKNNLYKAIMDFACKNYLREIRIQVSSQDPEISWWESLGFRRRWKTNIMGKLLDPFSYFKEVVKNKVDLKNDFAFNIQTPSLDSHKIGSGKKVIMIFIRDDIFNQLLMCRCNVANAVKNREITVLGGPKNSVYILSALFPLAKWRYFHIDYI